MKLFFISAVALLSVTSIAATSDVALTLAPAETRVPANGGMVMNVTLVNRGDT